MRVLVLALALALDLSLALALHCTYADLQVRNELEGLMGKLEKDLTEALIKVIMQSRVMTRRQGKSPRPPPSGRRSQVSPPPSPGSSRPSEIRSTNSVVANSGRDEAAGVGSAESAAPRT